MGPGGMGPGGMGPGGFGPRGPRGPHHRPPRRPFFFWGRPYHYPYYGFGGGWFFGGGIVIALLIAVIFAVTVGFVTCSATVVATRGGNTETGFAYSEEQFEDYAVAQYKKCYGTNSKESEDGILLVFTVYDTYDGYEAIAIVGYHVDENINELFGNSYTAFGASVTENIGYSFYKYTLSKSLVRIVSDMKDEVLAVKSGTGYTCNDDHAALPSQVIVDSALLDLDTDPIEKDLRAFTEETGIPLSIAVVDGEKVFPKTLTTVLVVFGVIIVAVVVVIIVRKRKKEEEDLRNGTGPDSYKGPEL